ncbi:MAG: glutamine--tRNA ligase/YqeY domain fusion protein [Phycisphaeraceae bacterium]
MPTDETRSHFIQQIIAEDLRTGRYPHVVTRFPPEPNGYLHIGHAKAICIDFGLAEQFGGKTHLRMDDTNPAKEEQEYIDAIQQDVAWLGFHWDRLCYASDYFPMLYDWACVLIDAGLAYVDDQSAEQVSKTRGSLTRPGEESPFRGRPVAENLDLFARMKAGEFPDGSRVLRAKIDMASPNVVMRDPVMYRILHATHPRTGDTWCIYPSYDYAHGQSDWIEGVTHSLCDTSFEIHRPLYEWFVDRLVELGQKSPACDYKPRQIEFARGNINYMITSKRKLLQLIQKGYVNDWSDPRMPTLRGMRRRGYTPAAIRQFWDDVGVAKRGNNLEFAKVESVLRDDLNKHAPRRMAVMDPLKVTITNWPSGQVDMLDAVNNPEDPAAGSRKVPFTGTIFIEREDFMEAPPKKFFRLSPGKEVRLRYAYFITCNEVVKDATGNIIELKCTYDPATRGGDSPDGRKVKATLHWVSADHAIDAELRLFDHLFTQPDPEDVPEGVDWLTSVNRDSMKAITHARLEPALAHAKPHEVYQFERVGYFTVDTDSTTNQLVFNRTVTLKDSWAKQQTPGS